MNRSLNEIEGLCKRAARGAGYGWGVSEEAGKAARWLASHSLPGPQMLATLLHHTDGVAQVEMAPIDLHMPWHAQKDALCPLASGAALNDTADQLARGIEIEMQHVLCPLLVVPFAAWAALHLKQPLLVTWDGSHLVTDGTRLWGDGASVHLAAHDAPHLTCRIAKATSGLEKSPALRGSVPGPVWQDLSRYAHRTYAPATEASRLLGAGAGTSDND